MRRKSKPSIEVWTPEGCFITELLNCDKQPEVSLARARVEPGVTTRLHQVSVLEWYILERGEGLMRVGDEAPYPVAPGDTVMIPKNVPQQIANVGSDDLCFLCVCTPRFVPDCYTALD